MGYLLLLPWSVLDPMGKMHLRMVPSVAEVKVIREGVPTHRIIHLLDYHYVQKDLFILDLEQFRNEKLIKEEADKEFAAFLADVEKIQTDQVMVLRNLKASGLKEIFCEGLSREELPRYRKLVPSVYEMVANLEERLKTETDKESRALFQVLLLSEREAVLHLGAPGRLLMKKEIDVLPLEDAKLHQDAKPIKDGKIVPDPVKIQARRDAIVRNCLSRKTAVIILGGSHDLTDSLRRIKVKDFEYLRVRVKSYEE